MRPMRSETRQNPQDPASDVLPEGILFPMVFSSEKSGLKTDDCQ
jgi:hypothetical protein